MLAILVGIGGCSSMMDPGEVSALVKPGTPQGACLITYNTGLVPEPADPCCFTYGGSNKCNLAARCNEGTGPQCCLFYSTDNDLIGATCCRYENNRIPPTSGEGQDITAPCNELLNSGR